MDTVQEKILVEVADALEADTAAQQAKLEPKNGEAAQGGTVAALLRVVGSLVLIAAAVAFLVQKWGSMDDVLRYLSFLGFTAVLTVAGFLCGLRIKEDKGARTFLALAASMVAVNFAQLGGLLLSTFPRIHGAMVPEIFRWTAPSQPVALATMIGAVAVLLPITAISMRVMARGMSKILTLAYVALNALLLVPSRDPLLVGVLFTLGIIAAAEVNRRISSETAAKTWEGFLARALLFVPPTIILGRNILLYEATKSLYGLAFLTVAYVVFNLIPRLLPESYRRFCEMTSYTIGSFGWLLLAQAIHSTLGLAPSLGLPLVALPIALVLMVVSLRVKSSGELERFLASILLTGSAAFELLCFSGLVSSLYCIVVGLGATVIGYANERKTLFISGCSCLGLGLVSQIRHAVYLYSMSPWVTLAILGIAIVVASSYAERHYSVIVSRVRSFGAELKAWK